MNLSVSETIRLWERVLEKLKQRIVDKNMYDTFFDGSYISEISSDTIIVVVNTSLAVQLCNTKYYSLLNEIVLEVTESNFKLNFITKDEEKKNSKIPQKQEEIFKTSYTNPNSTFDNFVIGTFNRSAAQAALMIASDPGKVFNPLFIHSESGLGKTHLLHAIGNYIKKNRPGAKVVCITSDDFFNEFVKNLSNGKDTTSLRDYCKTVDAFLIDDIQFLTEKKKTQELFYYVFNDLVKEEKQIVITSDRQPSELKDIEQRLVTRFSSGLTVKIDDPDPETCVAILKKKISSSDLKELNFEEDSLRLLAERFSKNIRELEGALNKLVYHAILKQTNQIDLKLTIEAVSTISGGKYIQNELDEQKIISLVSDYYNLTPFVLTGKSHNRQISLARHIAMYLIRDILDSPLKKIGQAFGNRDHTTVMSGISNVEKMLKTDVMTQQAIKELKSRIKSE